MVKKATPPRAAMKTKAAVALPMKKVVRIVKGPAKRKKTILKTAAKKKRTLLGAAAAARSSGAKAPNRKTKTKPKKKAPMRKAVGPAAQAAPGGAAAAVGGAAAGEPFSFRKLLDELFPTGTFLLNNAKPPDHRAAPLPNYLLEHRVAQFEAGLPAGAEPSRDHSSYGYPYSSRAGALRAMRSKIEAVKKNGPSCAGHPHEAVRVWEPVPAPTGSSSSSGSRSSSSSSSTQMEEYMVLVQMKLCADKQLVFTPVDGGMSGGFSNLRQCRVYTRENAKGPNSHVSGTWKYSTWKLLGEEEVSS